MLTAVGLLTLGLGWACLGTITTRVEGQGMMIRSDGSEVLLYVPADGVEQVRVGMLAEIVPSNARREDAGFVRGQVTEVAGSPTSTAALRELFGDGRASLRLGPRGRGRR